MRLTTPDSSGNAGHYNPADQSAVALHRPSGTSPELTGTVFPTAPPAAAPSGPLPIPAPMSGVLKPVIWFCPSLPLSSMPIRINGRALCGAGFHPGELVAIRLFGAHGTFTWTTVADLRGTFISSLPTQVCRDVPAIVRAFGNRGSISNTVSLPATSCVGYVLAPLTATG